MPDELFNRDIIINIDGLRIASRLVDKTRGTQDPSDVLKVTFKISRTLEKSPNKCELSIHNLSRQSRIRVQKKNTRTIVEAGYVNKNDNQSPY